MRQEQARFEKKIILMKKGKGKTKSEKVWVTMLFTFSFLLFTFAANAAELPAGYTQVASVQTDGAQEK